jgi:hypothetical protein
MEFFKDLDFFGLCGAWSLILSYAKYAFHFFQRRTVLIVGLVPNAGLLFCVLKNPPLQMAPLISFWSRFLCGEEAKAILVFTQLISPISFPDHNQR